MRTSWAVPVIFGILFFSTIFSAQNVYGPHYTSFDSLQYHFQGQGVFVFVNISDGIANQKKNANFEVCVNLERVVDSTIPTEIVALNLVSCQPITVIGESTQKNFVLAQVFIPTGPLSSSSQSADFFGFYEIVNPGGQSMAGKTIIEVRGVPVELDVPACIPPTCENSCNGHGTCVADDTCVCEKGWDSFPDCSVPDCNTNEDCDDGNQCTLDVCHENQCVPAQIPGCAECIPEPENDVARCIDGIDNDCDGTADFADSDCPDIELCDGVDNDNDGTVDEGFILGESCSVGVGACERDGTFVCNSSGGQTCSASPGTPSTENDQTTCTDGIDNDCDGLSDCDDSACADLGVTCSLPSCLDDADCGVGFHCDQTQLCVPDLPDGSSCLDDDECQSGFCDSGVCAPACVPEPEVCDGADNNCNGVIDDGFPELGTSCSAGVGQCLNVGQMVCSPSGGTECSATPGTPTAEICDGIDNDCDGTTDEDVACETPTTFRFTDLDLRDPHIFVDFGLLGGCRDVTDSSLFGTLSANEELQLAIQSDGNGDGRLDYSPLIIFRPLEQSSSDGNLHFAEGVCTAPIGSTTCDLALAPTPVLTLYTNVNSGTCLDVIPGTSGISSDPFIYNPPITTTSAPPQCFVSDRFEVNIPIVATIPLTSVQVAANYNGDPATGLANGLLRGFLPESVAENILFPPTLPFLGGQPLSSILPGGTGDCTSPLFDNRDDLDGDGTKDGWWFYFNYNAEQVPYVGP